MAILKRSPKTGKKNHSFFIMPVPYDINTAAIGDMLIKEGYEINKNLFFTNQGYNAQLERVTSIGERIEDQLDKDDDAGMLIGTLVVQTTQEQSVKGWQLKKQGIEQKYEAILAAEEKGTTDFSITAKKVEVIDEATEFNTDLSNIQICVNNIWIAPFFSRKVAETITPVELATISTAE